MPGPTDALGYSPGSPFYRAPGAGGFSLTPSPMSGQGVYGRVPGVLGLPSPATDLAAQYPNLTGTNAQVSNVIGAKLAGQVSPGTMNALKTAAAQWGVGAGLGPGSGLEMNKLFGNIAGFSENQAQQGLQDYASLIPTISHTQTVNPELQARIAEQNAVNLAAPDPAQAQSYAQRLFNDYLNNMRGGGRVSGLPPTNTSGETLPWNRVNPPPMGGVGRLGETTYGNQSNFGGYGGSSFGGYGGVPGGGGGMTEFDWIANQGFDPASYGIQPGGGSTYFAPPNTPFAGTQDYSQPIGPTPGSFSDNYPNLAGATDEELAALGIP